MVVLLAAVTFLVILLITYFARHRQPVASAHVESENRPGPRILQDRGFEIPQGYCFHPGHTWLLDEGGQNARVGVDGFAANLIGKIDGVGVTALNRWVRQGEKLLHVKSGDMTIDLVSPIEGVVVSVNPEVEANPGLITRRPYDDGWVCMIKAPELALNVRNLLRGNFVASWLQSAVRRIGEIVPQPAGATALDGGLPVTGLLAQVDTQIRRRIIKEFFLTDQGGTK